MKTVSIYKNGNLDMQLIFNDTEKATQEIKEWEELAKNLNSNKYSNTKIDVQ